MKSGTLMVVAAASAFVAGIALAQTAPNPSHGAMVEQSQPQPHTRMPMLPGQAAFGTIREVVGILEADPHTDWSRVNIPALRKHLIDMNELVLHARARPVHIPGGVRIAVTGEGRTLAAIDRMVPMHARTMNGRNGWSWSTKPIKDGVLLTVTTPRPAQVAMVRGLGFMGLMVEGSHHGMHHLAIARGQMKY